ncbi:isopeptide-forming domain-containing fimbrial protein [Clostridium sp. BJN0001]|uniref:isopeptide-forming domain-containing fimbrial protein n=1 Tax=Clostridium sp. BJN0001 TaxID=2930219 RepID=UPI001FD49849|nr:isopeptide-forming domain-containing fimbrial protein [Clostridium sp. BJN0001]
MAIRPLYNGQAVNFTVSFTASSDTTNYTSYVIEDTLALGLNYVSTSVTANSVTLIADTDYTVSSTTVDGHDVVTITVTNNVKVAGYTVVATINTAVDDLTQIVGGELTNTATVDVNGASGLEKVSNTVTINFETFQTVSISNTTTPNRVINAVVGNAVNFTGTFTAPDFSDAYSVVIRMALPTGTSLKNLTSSVVYGASSTDVGGTWSTQTGNIAQYVFTNSAAIRNQDITITLDSQIDNNQTIENSFNNVFKLAIGGNPETSSSAVTTIFVKPVSAVTKAVIDYTA